MAFHIILPLVVIVGVAIVGTYLLVASHAQTPPLGGGTVPAKLVCQSATYTATKSSALSLAGKYTAYVLKYKVVFKNIGNVSSVKTSGYGLGYIASAGSTAGQTLVDGNASITVPALAGLASYTYSGSTKALVFKADVSDKYFGLLQSSAYQTKCTTSIKLAY